MILNRIKQYIDSKGITIAAFERSIGMSNASFGKSLKKGGTIGSDKLEKILQVYSDLSPVWLLTGEGSMLKGEGEATDTELKPGKSESVSMEVMNKIAAQAEEIGRLKERNSQLERENMNLQAIANTPKNAMRIIKDTQSAEKP